MKSLDIIAFNNNLDQIGKWGIPLKNKNLRSEILKEIKSHCDSNDFNPFENLVDESVTIIMKVTTI